jgi:hypothetical protein
MKKTQLEQLLEKQVKDAERFQYLQNCDPVEAQAFFWNYSSRTERAKAIDVARAAAIAAMHVFPYPPEKAQQELIPS